MKDGIIAGVRPAFRALAEAFVPESRRLDDAEWAEVEATVEYALSRRPPAIRRQIGVLIRVLDVLPLLRFGKRMRDLDVDRRLRVLNAIQNAPILLLRKGVWGLRTLVFMGYYTRAAAAAEIGYRAHLRGWQARGRTAAAT